MIRPYQPGTDDAALWSLKRAFERSLGTTTGDDAKAAAYRTKLDAKYRDRYLAWAARCVAAEACIHLAEVDEEVAGYVFVLPERLALIWDGAVINELFVTQTVRGTGTADALLAAGLATARAQTLPLDRILLDVDPDNGRARAFYERHDFEPWGEVIAKPLPK